jgi:hypothetical protein
MPITNIQVMILINIAAKVQNHCFISVNENVIKI